MRAVVATGVLSLVLSASPIRAQAPTPGPEHEKLGYWVGTWHVDVEYKRGGLGPAGKEQWTYAYEWFPGRFQLVLRAKQLGPKNPTMGLALVGYDNESGAYFFYEIISNGMAVFLKGTRQGRVWQYTCDRTVDGKPVGIRLVMREVSSEAWMFTMDESVAGGPWVRSQEGRGTRVK
jgi:hypothetical protein